MRRQSWLLRLIAIAATALFAPGVRCAPFTESPAADEVFYQFMPIAWRNSGPNGGPANARFGDFNGMTASLDYLQGLGVTSVWMNPIFPSPAYHGYQYGPADRVNPWFGTEAEFLNFVAQAKLHGIKVYIDLVCYGISTNSTFYQSAYNNPSSPYDAWLAFTNAQNTQFTGYSYTTWNGSTVGFIDWDLRNAGARQQVIDWCKKWLDPHGDGTLRDGIAGYRLDHVLVNGDQQPAGLGYTMAGFWTPWKAALKTVNPDVFTFVEQADWGSFGNEFLSVHDAAFTMPFMFAARDAVMHENATELYPSMASTLSALKGAGQGTLLGIINNHDVDRLASALYMTGPENADRTKAAAAVLMLQPFPPVIYMGDELGMTGVKGNYGSDANDIPVREPFKWTAVNAGAPMSNYFVLNSGAYNNRYERDHDGKSVEEQQGVAGSLLETYRSLIALRKNTPALRRGGYTAVSNSDSHIWSFVRRYAPAAGDPQTLLVAINLGGPQWNGAVDMSGFTLPTGGTGVKDVVTGAALAAMTGTNKGAYPVSVGPYGYRVMELNATPPVVPPAVVDGIDIPASVSAAAVTVTQDTPTNFGDNVSELDQLFAKGQSDGLLVGITGNLATDGTALAVFVDTGSGGQNILDTSTLAPPPGGLQALTALKMDAGFSPSQLFFANTNGGTLYLDQVALPASGSGIKTYRGNNVVNGHSGTLSGGSNADGIQAAFDNTNTNGVTGTIASSAATATTGFEIFVPWSALGVSSPMGKTMRIASCILGSDGTVSNQWLPGIEGGTANLGIAPDLTGVPGMQFARFTVGAPYVAADAVHALQVAGGLASATAEDARLDLNGGPGIDLVDAAMVMRKALGL
ncbi:MAG TPA: alpha-amylase family glycosyl hydrolase [Armatimonadota bacterium]